MALETRIVMNGCVYKYIHGFIKYLRGESFFHSRVHMFFLPPASFCLLSVCHFQFSRFSVLIILKQLKRVFVLNVPRDHTARQREAEESVTADKHSLDT